MGTEPWLITIGDRATLSSNVRLATYDGSGWLVRDNKGRRFRYAPIQIGSDVLIGAESIVMRGVTIGDRVVVGAGSVVTKNIPGNTVVAGVPARRIRSFDEFESDTLRWPAEADLAGLGYRDRVARSAEMLAESKPIERIVGETNREELA